MYNRQCCQSHRLHTTWSQSHLARIHSLVFDRDYEICCEIEISNVGLRYWGFCCCRSFRNLACVAWWYIFVKKRLALSIQIVRSVAMTTWKISFLPFVFLKLKGTKIYRNTRETKLRRFRSAFVRWSDRKNVMRWFFPSTFGIWNSRPKAFCAVSKDLKWE